MEPVLIFSEMRLGGQIDRQKDRESDFAKASKIFTAEPSYNESDFATPFM